MRININNLIMAFIALFTCGAIIIYLSGNKAFTEENDLPYSDICVNGYMWRMTNGCGTQILVNTNNGIRALQCNDERGIYIPR